MSEIYLPALAVVSAPPRPENVDRIDAEGLPADADQPLAAALEFLDRRREAQALERRDPAGRTVKHYPRYHLVPRRRRIAR